MPMNMPCVVELTLLFLFFHYSSNLTDKLTVISAIVVNLCRIGSTI